MAKTLAQILAGEDMEGDEEYCDTIYNDTKNHWRAAAFIASPEPGIIQSISTAEKLYHRQAAAWQEIIQTATPISDDAQIIGGDGSDTILIPYEETTNDAVIWGLPVDPKRGLIFCDVADIAVDFTGLITAHTQPVAWWIDLDNDSYLGVGHQADDRPGIWSGAADTSILAIQYDANADITVFENSGAGENRLSYIYGYVTVGAAVRYGSFQVEDANDEFVISAENNANIEGVTINIPETNQRFRIRQNADILSWYLDGTDVFMRWSDGQLEFQTDETDATTVLRIKPNGTSEVSQFDFYDADGIRLSLYTAADRAYILSGGGVLGINPDAAQGVGLFENATSGETPEVKIYGFRAADAKRSLEIGVGVNAANTASFDGVDNYYFDGNVGVGYPNIGGGGVTGTLEVDGNIALQTAINDTRALVVTGGVLELRATDANHRIIIRGDSGNDYINELNIIEYGEIGLHAGAVAGVETNTLILQAAGVAMGTSTWGTNAAIVFTMTNGTAPTTSPADQFQMWSDDVLSVAGKAGPHYRSEEGGMFAWHGGAGTINNFTYQADVADEGSFTLPAITDAAWGFVQAGNNEEYALFTIDNVGNVTLLSNSANVVANADIDGDLCLGILSPEEPLTIKNRLGAQKNINLIIWYS